MKRKIGYRLMVFMTRHMIACDEASFLVSYRSDNRLGLVNWMRLKMHLLSCHLCRKYAHQIVELNQSVAQYREVVHSEACFHHLPDKANDKIQHAVENQLNLN